MTQQYALRWMMACAMCTPVVAAKRSAKNMEAPRLGQKFHDAFGSLISGDNNQKWIRSTRRG